MCRPLGFNFDVDSFQLRTGIITHGKNGLDGLEDFDDMHCI